MARYVDDLTLVLGVISGVDWRDPHIVPMPLGDPGAVDLKGLRAAFFTDNGVVPVSPETAQVIRSAAKALSEAGAAVEEARPEGIENNFDIWMSLAGADAGASVRALLEEAGTKETHYLLAAFLTDGQPLSAFEYSALLVRLDEYRSSMLRFMETHDVILCPVNSNPATPHGASLSRFPDYSYNFQFNLTGWPGAVVRGGTSQDGLPIGVQAAAAPWREDVALAVARHLETALGGYQRPPV
jgi:amidase